MTKIISYLFRCLLVLIVQICLMVAAVFSFATYHDLLMITFLIMCMLVTQFYRKDLNV